MSDKCANCDGDGYVDIVDDWGGVVGPAPCPECSADDPFDTPGFSDLGYQAVTNAEPRGETA